MVIFLTWSASHPRTTKNTGLAYLGSSFSGRINQPSSFFYFASGSTSLDSGILKSSGKRLISPPFSSSTFSSGNVKSSVSISLASSNSRKAFPWQTATLCKLKAWNTSLILATVVPSGTGETSTNLDIINMTHINWQFHILAFII